jgi:hypothetical protein
MRFRTGKILMRSVVAASLCASAAFTGRGGGFGGFRGGDPGDPGLAPRRSP